MDCKSKSILRIWEDEELVQNRSSAVHSPVLQLEELQVRQFALGKSCGVIVSDDDAHSCYQIGQPGSVALTVASIETSLQELSFFKSQHVVEIACGYHHVAALVSPGHAFCWGFSAFGQCGIVANIILNPNPVKVLDDCRQLRLRSVSCGRHHTLAISEDRQLYGWGRSQMIASTISKQHNTPCPTPECLYHLCGRKILQVSCGKSHSAVLTEKIGKTSPPVRSPDAIEICAMCQQEIYKCGDKELT